MNTRRKRVAFSETLSDDAVGMHGGSTLQALLSDIIKGLGRALKLRIQVYGFDAMCRMIAAGVGIGVVPKAQPGAMSTPWTSCRWS